MKKEDKLKEGGRKKRVGTKDAQLIGHSGSDLKWVSRLNGLYILKYVKKIHVTIVMSLYCE